MAMGGGAATTPHTTHCEEHLNQLQLLCLGQHQASSSFSVPLPLGFERLSDLNSQASHEGPLGTRRKES